MELFSNFTSHHLLPIQILSLITLGQLCILFTYHSTAIICFRIPPICQFLMAVTSEITKPYGRGFNLGRKFNEVNCFQK